MLLVDIIVAGTILKGLYSHIKRNTCITLKYTLNL